MKRRIALAVFSMLFCYSSLSLAAMATGEAKPQHEDPADPSARKMDAGVVQPDLTAYLEDFKARMQKEKNDGKTVFGQTRDAIDIQKTLVNPIMPVAMVSGNAGTGRTSKIRAVFQLGLRPDSLISKKPWYRLRTNVLLSDIKKGNLTQSLATLKTIVEYVESNNGILVIDGAESLNFASSGKALDVINEAIADKRCPMVIGTNPGTESKMREVEGVDQRVRTFATGTYDYETSLRILRQQALALDPTGTVIPEDVIVHLATQTGTKRRLGANGNSKAIQALHDFAGEYILEHQQNLSQIGKWEDEVAGIDVEIRSKQRGGSLSAKDLEDLQAKKALAEAQLKGSQINVVQLDKQIGKLKAQVDEFKNDITQTETSFPGIKDLNDSGSEADKSGWSLIGRGNAKSKGISAETIASYRTLKASLAAKSEELATLVDQRANATTTGRTPPAKSGIQMMNEVLAKLTNQTPDLFSDISPEAINNLEALLGERIFGQDVAKKVLARTVQLLFDDMKVSEGGGLLFPGPPGVGKTESVKALADILGWGFVKESMSNYMDIVTKQNFLGVGGGLVGSDKRSKFIQKLLDAPENSIILLDEIEKAHPDVITQLIEALGEGQIQSAYGDVVSLKNKIIIMTTNLGTEFYQYLAELEKPVGQRTITEEQRASWLSKMGLTEENIKKIVDLDVGSQARSAYVGELYKTYLRNNYAHKIRPEIFSRLDVVAFDHLSPEVLEKVVTKFSTMFRARVYDNKGVLSFLSDAAFKQVLSKYQEDEGARPLLRYLQDNLNDALRNAKGVGPGNVVLFDFENDEFKAHVVEKQVFDRIATQAGILKSADVLKEKSEAGTLGKDVTKFNDKGVISREIIQRIVADASKIPR